MARPSAQHDVRGALTASLLEGLSAQERRSICLMPFIARPQPPDHHFRREAWLANLSGWVPGHELSGEDLSGL